MEGRLTAAADNLARLEDVIMPLATRLAGLQRQARQAQRYRRLGEEVRRHAALLFYSRWTTAEVAANDRSAELSKVGRPLLCELRVRAGFEKAVGALFADELLAPIGAGTETEEAAGITGFWTDLGTAGGPSVALPAGPALPKGAHPLGETVDAPAALARSLAQAGWVDSVACGRTLQSRLLPGQRLVDREGRLWLGWVHALWKGPVVRGAPPRTAEPARRAGRGNCRNKLAGTGRASGRSCRRVGAARGG
ncbi:MAG: hypothetical protein ACREE2_06560 [Stellaceae bacterium]